MSTNLPATGAVVQVLHNHKPPMCLQMTTTAKNHHAHTRTVTPHDSGECNDSFSITAYLTVLLIFHYTTVYDPNRTSAKGNSYPNPVDHGILTTIRTHLISWKPSRRFKYAMEKSVLILSDAQLVTGLAILIFGYSQLDCSITAYHWQIMVFIAWFSTFTFLSAMAFLKGYFQENNNLCIIRLCFMVVLGSIQIVALLPTGSRNWLDPFDEGGGFYPSLPAECYFEQLSMRSFLNNGPRIRSMIFSILVVGFSYIHSSLRLFDPTAELTRKYLRAIPGSYLKQALFFLEKQATQRALRATPWIPAYAIIFDSFTSLRALYDISESMLAEITWLTSAIAWGTIKVWDTRNSLTFNFDGEQFTDDNDIMAEDSWSF
ncbi:hypothetical protein K458DRAFT_431473 [Lentithecium fluviatile CBS 122367]|uniref:Uncharacterized protein n=1 Tax=Lentithecium fluviatile CBS 122367 TaxID=1168545 RepID=A0A6G1J340_9PLEO|nr:hypothetical protein K458DRAFT_431473 [Lentithecium fluviatile CBS 122367]